MSIYSSKLDQHEIQLLVQDLVDKKKGKCYKTWQEIVDEYGLGCSEDLVRKISLGVELAKDAGLLISLNESVDRDYVERQKIRDIQKDIRKDMRELSRTELICEHIQNAIKALPPITIETISLPNKNPKRDLIIGMGDFHYGADFEVYGLHGEVINKYNSKVFEKRMSELTGHILQICEKESPEQLTIMIVGDMLDGILRTSQLQRLEFGVVDSAIYFAETFTSWLVNLAKEVNLPIRVYGVRGNHGEIRPLGTKAGQFPEENMERIVMHYLYARFKDIPNVTIEDNDAPMIKTIDICGYHFVLTHGQQSKIESMAKDYINLYQKPVDAFVIGHWHKSQTFNSGILPEGNIFVECIPSFCGIDPYAQSKGYGAYSGVTIILMEEGYGRKCVYPIVLK